MANKKWHTVREFVKDFSTLITGGIISLVIFISQCNQSKELAKSNQKLLILQIFSDKLMGNVYDKQMVFSLLDNIEDQNLADSLKKISDLAFIEFYQDSIWSTSPNQRENVIKEFARIYKRLPKEILAKIREEATPIGDKTIQDYIDQWPLTISVTKFFYYISNFGYEEWYGTEADSIFFANFKKSKYYLHPDEAPAPNIHKYVEIMLKNFRKIKS